ncbi:hypothetical protein RUM43_011234 [Polyplax serrata]|uniref:Spaetzle domain-containing protein n=1 Tax=Polyplax serrata TaxID=468196 RepID=A0AAN8NLT4_POLSC
MEDEGNLFYSTTVLLFLPILAASPNCTEYGVCNHYVPALPGHVPSCAKSGNTYCEHIDHYPMLLIKYLIEKSDYDYNTLLNNESTDDFVYRKLETYGPPSYTQPQVQLFYPPPPPPPPPPVIQPALTYGPLPLNLTYQQPTQGGYPDRRYKIDPHLLTNALQQPPGYHLREAQYVRNVGDGGGYFYSAPIVPPYRPNWWHRYKRSTGSHNREKRQTQPRIVNQLCPTASNFIMPKAALNTKGSWMYTVNLYELDNRYTQLVRSETCITDQCNGLCSLPNGYSSRCEQKYVQKRLVALDAGGQRLYSDTFWFPHCCICQITTN